MSSMAPAAGGGGVGGERSVDREASPGRPAWALVGVLTVLGVAARLAPFLDPAGRMFRQFPTEDGYLMLTIARNLALGAGMSISAGTVATNGTQPLATLLYAGCFWLVGAERAAGVALALLLQLAVAAVAAGLLFVLGRAVFGAGARGRWLAAFTAALWFSAPLVVRHSMNCLETGLHAACGLGALLAVLRAAERPAPAYAAWAAAGALLGVAFWARNDAVLLCAAVGAAHLLGWTSARPSKPAQRFAELAAAGAAALAVALPWLVHNAVRFGNIVPVSGQAEALHVAFASNLARVPTKLVEYLLVVVPIPAVVEEAASFLILCTLGIAGVVAALAFWARPEPGVRRAVLSIGAGYAAALCLFYGLFFGAGHFMSRYLFPLSPLLALLLVFVARRSGSRAPRFVQVAGSVALVVLVAAYGLRLYARGAQHEHGQVIDWVEAHVAPEVWVGAVQTGTLGFFHDRTVNLDGKVNPVALAHRRVDTIPRYVVDSDIDFLVDWAGIASWIDKDPIGDHFELLLEDRARNLAVLRRREPRSPLASRGVAP